MSDPSRTMRALDERNKAVAELEAVRLERDKYMRWYEFWKADSAAAWNKCEERRVDAERWQRARACVRIGQHGEFVILPGDEHDREDVKVQFDAALDAAPQEPAQEPARQEPDSFAPGIMIGGKRYDIPGNVLAAAIKLAQSWDDDERAKIVAEVAAAPVSARPPAREHVAAVDTLQRLGYTYHGGQLWKPPLGKRPPAREPVAWCIRWINGGYTTPYPYRGPDDSAMLETARTYAQEGRLCLLVPVAAQGEPR